MRGISKNGTNKSCKTCNDFSQQKFFWLYSIYVCERKVIHCAANALPRNYNTTPTGPTTEFRNSIAFIRSGCPAAFAKQMGQSSSQRPGHIYLKPTALEVPLVECIPSDTHTKRDGNQRPTQVSSLFSQTLVMLDLPECYYKCLHVPFSPDPSNRTFRT